MNEFGASPPLFSIVIPTRNRAELLYDALQSTLDQTLQDFEVVVVDDFSEDNTALVVKEFTDKRIRYVRTPQFLPVNDAWEFAISQARGHYVCVLPDDCACPPWFLERMASIIESHEPEMICFEQARYYSESSRVYKDVQNELHIYAFTREVRKVDSRDELKRRFQQATFAASTPLISNVCYRRAFVERIKEKTGCFCLPPNCENVASTLALAMTKTFIYIDEPIYVYGQIENRSLTMAFKTFDSNFRKLQQIDYRHVPLNGVYGTNRKIESLLRAKELLRDELANFQLNWEPYFYQYYVEMRKFQEQGLDVSDDIKEFWRVLGQQPPDIQAKVRSAINARFFPTVFNQAIRKGLRRLVDSLPILRRLESRVRPRHIQHRSKWPVIIRGADAGFSNILECSRKLESLLANIQPDEEALQALATKFK